MCKKILFEDTFQALYNNTVSRFPTDRKTSSARVQLTTTMFVPAVNNAALEMRAKSRTDGATYDTVIYFKNVEYVDEQTPNAISFQATDGSEYFITPISRNSEVEVNCTCLDFHWMFAVWNDKKNSLFGDAPDHYVKKTDKEPKNPQQAPGLCKHLMKFFEYLIREQIIK